MTNTIGNIILSILNTKNDKFIAHKISDVEDQLHLNEVERKIVKDIKNIVELGKSVTPSFIKNKYSYYVDSDDILGSKYLDKDSIDSAILELGVNQEKTRLSRSLVDFGGKVSTMTPKEIKERFSDLHSTTLVENRGTVPGNAFIEKKSAYEDLTKKTSGLSLCIPEIESYAGHAVRGTIVSILAFVGHMKSLFALNIAYANAMKGHNVLYLSLESTSDLVIDRLVIKHIAENAKSKDELINSAWVRDGSLTPVQKELYDKAHNDLFKKIGNNFIVWDSTAASYDNFLEMQNTLRNADQMFKKTTGKGLDAIVLDQLALLKYTTGSTKKKATYDGAIMNDWVSFFNAQSLNFLDEGRQIVTFMVSQVKRDAFAEASKPKKKGRYDASAASDSHEIERASSTIITLYKDYENADTLLINIPKARQGLMPDNPIHIEAYGAYYHVGPLQFEQDSLSAEDFTGNIDLADLINN